MTDYKYRGRSIYHVTKTSNLESIAERGLLPTIGNIESSFLDLSFNVSPCICLTDSIECAESFATEENGEWVILEMSMDEINLFAMRADHDQVNLYLAAVNDTDITESDEFPNIPWPLSFQKTNQATYVERIPPHKLKILKYLGDNPDSEFKSGDILNPEYINEVWKEKGSIRKASFGFIQSFEAKEGESSMDFPDDIQNEFRRLGHLQRELPERAMVDAQMLIGGGELSFCIEHVGDLYHRMTHHAEFGKLYPGIIDDKVQKTLYRFESSLSFEEKHIQNMKNSSEYNNIPLDEYIKRAKEATLIYANEHRKLPVYNKAQYYAREASVSLGEHNFDRTKLMLGKLKELVSDYDKFNKVASTVIRDKKGKLMEIPSPEYIYEDKLDNSL